MTNHVRILAPLLAAAALAAGCGGGSSQSAAGGYDDDTPAQATPAAAKTAAAPAPAASSATTIVAISGPAFQPGDVALKVGDTVKFVNQDEIAHTATANDQRFDSKTLNTGDSYTFTATKAGSISYVCAFHPGMTGTIEVAS